MRLFPVAFCIINNECTLFSHGGNSVKVHQTYIFPFLSAPTPRTCFRFEYTQVPHIKQQDYNYPNTHTPTHKSHHSKPPKMHFSPSTTTTTTLLLVVLLTTTPPTTTATPLPPSPSKVKDTPALNLTLYTLPGCKGAAHTYPSIHHNDHISASPARTSYRLSQDLDKHDYMTFHSSKPFVAEGDARKEGCHDLPDGEAFWVTFMESGEDESG